MRVRVIHVDAVVHVLLGQTTRTSASVWATLQASTVNTVRNRLI